MVPCVLRRPNSAASCFPSHLLGRSVWGAFACCPSSTASKYGSHHPEVKARLATAPLVATFRTTRKSCRKPSYRYHGSTFPHSQFHNTFSSDVVQARRYIVQVIISQATVGQIPGIDGTNTEGWVQSCSGGGAMTSLHTSSWNR